MTTATSKPGWWAKIRRWLLLVLSIVALGVLGYLLYAGFTYGWPAWTGFGPYTPPQPPIEGYQREKTLWDWLQLLVIPLVLAVAAFFLNRTERINAEKAAEQRAKTEREIAEQRAMDAVLETYLDRMTELLIDKQLLKSQPEDEIRGIARTRTLTALRLLDSEHNQILTEFLQDAKLLVGQSTFLGDEELLDGQSTPIIDLSGANLAGADLERANLVWASLQVANLQGANLQGAFLAYANLYGANLQGANLQGADLPRTNLQEANLAGANLKDTALGGANLQGATMPDSSKHD